MICVIDEVEKSLFNILGVTKEVILVYNYNLLGVTKESIDYSA